ncbi:hypothetical protein PLESTB_001749800 [Pleodorina starrii]|uniref:Uncharacterized protein n=1 Tax=Pleodorina starrii TaxID=330485 RepID=A0A9W6F9J0_9CHLO|nr:hypothetical protein PLESTB_001749800 [Pleodorina starrii]
MTPVAPRAAPGVRLVTTFRSRGARNSLRPAAASAVPPRNPATSPPQQPGPPSASNDPAATSRPRRPPAWIVGVDFGTYASGFGYSKAASPDSSSSSNSGGEAQPDVGTAPPPAPVKLHHSWPDQPLQDFKTRTVCLYRGNKLEAWGWPAWKRWTTMTDQERREGNYCYVEEFKLLLQGGGGGGGGPAAVLPPGVTEVQVVADFLSELRGYIYRHLARASAAAASSASAAGSDPDRRPLDPTSIAWCLTVPAMWDEAAKAKMRQAANRAGMARASDPGSLTMVLEPEAAAAAAVVHQQRISRKASTAAPAAEAAAEAKVAGTDTGDGAADAAKAAELREVAAAAAVGPGGDGSSGGAAAAAAAAAATASATAPAATLVDGDVLLVLDCGGGTADITMHRVVGSGTAVRLQEAAAGKGVLAGGRFVDDALWRYLRDSVVGAQVWDQWRAVQPGEWVQTATEWEAAKSQPRGPVTLQLRPNLMDLIVRQQQQQQQQLNDANDGNGQRPSASFHASSTAAGGGGGGSAAASGASAALRADGSVVVSEEILEREIYGPVVDQIVAAAADVLDQGRRGGNACTKMLLAGGMANSPYVQQRVRQLAQECRVPLLMPRQPQALVVSGAVLFGQYPALVTARRSRLTYGISCRSLWTSDDAASAAAFGYPPKLWKDEDREYVADGVFEVYVRRNELVGLDQVVRRTFCPTSRTTTAVGIDLYATDAEEGRYTAEPGMRRVAAVVMELPAGWTASVPRRQDYDIEVELRFGGTEITLFARDPRTNNAVATSVQWTPEAVTTTTTTHGSAAATAGGTQLGR